MKDLERLARDPSACLLVVDQQLDFEPGGALAVSGGDEIVPAIAEWMGRFSHVILTQDSHPQQHISFASSYEDKQPFDVITLAGLRSGDVRSSVFLFEELETYLSRTPGQSQTLWPDHCVVGSEGWSFDTRLVPQKAELILRKGTKQKVDSYSAFFENDASPTGLSGYLRGREIRKVVTVGLAGDYCVAWSALDARREGFEVSFVERLTRYVNFPSGSREAIHKRLKAVGVQMIDEV